MDGRGGIPLRPAARRGGARDHGDVGDVARWRCNSALSEQPLADTLLDYTNFYIRFALGRGFDPDHPGWREYVAGLRDVHDQREWTYRFYMGRSSAKAGPDVTATFGCFAYAPLAPDRVRLHFENSETGDGSPLAVERRGERLADLAELFTHLKRTTEQEVKENVAREFLSRLRHQSRLDALDSCFPLSMLGLEASASEFYSFYGV